MVAKRSTKMGKIKPYVDVRSAKDVPAFESLIKTGPVFVLVYADWCGHCQRFKENMWNEVANAKNKAVNTAAVHYDMVDKTSMKNTPIEGYPTLFEVKPTPKSNNTKPIATPQTKEELEELVGVKNLNNSNIKNNNSNSNMNMNMKNNNSNSNSNSNMNMNEAENAMNMTTNEPKNNWNIRSERVMRNSQNAQKDTFVPATLDELNNQPPSFDEDAEEEELTNMTEPTSQRGGSLMETLLKISANTAHAVVLAGSAMEISRRLKKGKHTRRHRSSKKKQTRRR